MLIVADTNIPFLKGVLEPYAEVRYYDGRAIGREEMKDADAVIIRTRTRCNRETLEGSRVKMIASATIGNRLVPGKRNRGPECRGLQCLGRGRLRFLCALRSGVKAYREAGRDHNRHSWSGECGKEGGKDGKAPWIQCPEVRPSTRRRGRPGRLCLSGRTSGRVRHRDNARAAGCFYPRHGGG